jgi:hypothetical protein
MDPLGSACPLEGAGGVRRLPAARNTRPACSQKLGWCAAGSRRASRSYRSLAWPGLVRASTAAGSISSATASASPARSGSLTSTHCGKPTCRRGPSTSGSPTAGGSKPRNASARSSATAALSPTTRITTRRPQRRVPVAARPHQLHRDSGAVGWRLDRNGQQPASEQPRFTDLTHATPPRDGRQPGRAPRRRRTARAALPAAARGGAHRAAGGRGSRAPTRTAAPSTPPTAGPVAWPTATRRGRNRLRCARRGRAEPEEGKHPVLGGGGGFADQPHDYPAVECLVGVAVGAHRVERAVPCRLGPGPGWQQRPGEQQRLLLGGSHGGHRPPSPVAATRPA